MSIHDTLTETHAMLNNTKSVYNVVDFCRGHQDILDYCY